MFRTKAEIEHLKQIYPSGTKITMLHMCDDHPVPKGTHGVVDFVDDGGMIHMDWENGMPMAIDPSEDEFKVDLEKVIYVEKRMKNVIEALKKENAEFHIGNIVEQRQGKDMSYHGSPFYETITIIQDGDLVFEHSDFGKRYYPNKIEFERMSDLSKIEENTIKQLQDEIAELENKISIKKQEISNVQNNFKRINETFAQVLNEESEEIVCKQEMKFE